MIGIVQPQAASARLGDGGIVRLCAEMCVC